jgi:hypothetical protein
MCRLQKLAVEEVHAAVIAHVSRLDPDVKGRFETRTAARHGWLPMGNWNVVGAEVTLVEAAYQALARGFVDAEGNPRTQQCRTQIRSACGHSPGYAGECHHAVVRDADLDAVLGHLGCDSRSGAQRKRAASLTSVAWLRQVHCTGSHARHAIARERVRRG